jgi:RHS repeat-associated protein
LGLIKCHSTIINLRFAGQYYDAETGLHYNYYRYYDPQSGRYITSDPIGLEGGLNTYSYVGNNPVFDIDPLGLSATLLGPICGGSGCHFPPPSPPIDPTITDPLYNESGSAAGPAPHSHADETAALRVQPYDPCEELKWAIKVLEEQIAWRKTDLNPRHKGTRLYKTHQDRIKKLQNHRDKLKKAYNDRGCEYVSYCDKL